MPQAQRPIPPHTEIAYQFIDVLDRIAETNRVGPGWAKVLASDAIASAAALYPNVAKYVLGADVVAAHKSVAEKLLVALKATQPGMVTVQMTREEADAWQAAIANEGNKNIIALLRQVAGAQVGVSAGGKLTDSGDQSKSMTKAAKVDPIQALIQGDMGGWDGR